jgi:hypothetical protein
MFGLFGRKKKEARPVVLGEIDLPEGILVILDPGLGRYWRHDQAPDRPVKDKAGPPSCDLHVMTTPA